MSILSIISLIFTIVRYIPKLIKIAPEVIRLIRQMKDENWIGDIRIIFEIIKLLLDLAPTNKELVALNFEELRHRLRDRDREGIEKMRNSLKRRKTMFDPMDTVEKV